MLGSGHWALGRALNPLLVCAQLLARDGSPSQAPRGATRTRFLLGQGFLSHNRGGRPVAKILSFALKLQKGWDGGALLMTILIPSSQTPGWLLATSGSPHPGHHLPHCSAAPLQLPPEHHV